MVLLLDAGATRRGLLDALLAASKLWWSQVVFVFIGHGAETQVELFDGLLGYDEIAAAVNDLPAAQRLIILDTCHSGGAADAFGDIGKIGGLSPRETMLDLLSIAYSGTRFLAAAPADGTTVQIGTTSLFSHALLWAAGDATRDARLRTMVTAAEVFDVAAAALVSAGHSYPVARGHLADLPFCLSDAEWPYGSVAISDLRPYTSRNRPRRPVVDVGAATAAVKARLN